MWLLKRGGYEAERKALWSWLVMWSLTARLLYVNLVRDTFTCVVRSHLCPV